MFILHWIFVSHLCLFFLFIDISIHFSKYNFWIYYNWFIYVYSSLIIYAYYYWFIYVYSSLIIYVYYYWFIYVYYSLIIYVYSSLIIIGGILEKKIYKDENQNKNFTGDKPGNDLYYRGCKTLLTLVSKINHLFSPFIYSKIKFSIFTPLWTFLFCRQKSTKLNCGYLSRNAICGNLLNRIVVIMVEIFSSLTGRFS